MDHYARACARLLRDRGLKLDPEDIDSSSDLYDALENLPEEDEPLFRPAAKPTKPRELSTTVSPPRTLLNGLTPADSQFLAHRAARVSRGGRERGR